VTAREPTGDEGARRIAGGQARRLVNESIAQQAARFDGRDGIDETVFQFLCECGRPDCRLVLHLTLDEFADLSRRGAVTGHA